MNQTHRVLLFGFLLVMTGLCVNAFASTPEEAEQAGHEGRWMDAAELWEGLAEETDLSPERARVRWRAYLEALAATGDWNALDDEASRIGSLYPSWGVPAVFRAKALASRGRVAEALEFLTPVAETFLPARAELIHLLTVLGKRDEAGALASAMIKSYRPGKNYLSESLVAFGHAARYRGDFKGAARMYELAYKDSVGYLDARIHLAYLFREKYQATLAAEELNQAGRLSPRHPDVLLAAARLSLQGNQMVRAESAANEVLELRPKDAGARCVLAQLALIAEQPGEATKASKEVLDQNPTDRLARSVLAAAAYYSGDSTGYHQETESVLAQDPGYLEVFLILGGLLEKARRNEEAFAMYRRVLEREPDNPSALIAFGLLAMREGDESKARQYLERGFEGDAYNIRAYNQLELLDKMDTFTSFQTEHFDIRMDAANDSLLLPLLEERLEKIYQELVTLHGWQPSRSTIVEIFPSHDWFSARVTGLPWIGGIPAVCFGHVVAMDSPKTLSGSTNWEDVLRHEFGHVLALGMTGKKVPFWFTEGLSVFLEAYPRGRSWDENLVAAALDGELIPVDSLTIGFTRPKHFSQRLLAYHESGLIIEDLVNRKGWEVIPKLLTAFGAGKDLNQALKEEAGESEKAFAKRALEVVRQEAAALQVWPSPSKARLERLAAITGKAAKKSAHLELLALTQFQLGLKDEATETCKTLLEIDADNPRAYGVLGLLDVAADRLEAGFQNLERAIALKTEDIPVYRTLARLEEARGDTLLALRYHADVLALYPLEIASLQSRARLLAAQGDHEGARREYQTVLTLTGSGGSAALALARMEMEANRGEDAARALDYAVSVLPLEAEVEALRGQAFLLLDRDREAFDLFRKARALDLRSVEAMVGMARYYFKQDDYDEAVFFAELALKYDPDHPVAKKILEAARAG